MPVTGLKVVIHHMLAIHPSLPPSHSAVPRTRLPGAFPAELQREWCLSVALVTTGPCVISLQKLGRSQDVLYGVILDWDHTGHRRSSSAVHWMG